MIKTSRFSKVNVIIVTLVLALAMIPNIMFANKAQGGTLGSYKYFIDVPPDKGIGSVLLKSMDSTYQPGVKMFCIDGFIPAPEEKTDFIKYDEINVEPHNFDFISSDYKFDNDAEVYYLMEKYKDSDDNSVEMAALAWLIHLNFEDPNKVTTTHHYNYIDRVKFMYEPVIKKYPELAAKARELVKEAREAHISGYSTIKFPAKATVRGLIENIGVTNPDGKLIPDRDYQFTLYGPAVFAANHQKTITGKTKSTPISLEWISTGNGKVTTVGKIASDRDKLYRMLTKPGVQTMLQPGINGYDPVYKDLPTTEFNVAFDFQPMGESNVKSGKFIQKNGVVSDTFKAFADPSYSNTEWMSFDGKPIPVTYQGTAYYVGESPLGTSKDVPANAEKLGTVSIVANGPGEYNAQLPTPLSKPGFVVWKWEMNKSDQKGSVNILDGTYNYSDLIKANWSEDFAPKDETSVKPFEGNIDSTMSIRKTRSGIYLVDDVWVDGLPSDHPDFSGNSEFKADAKEIIQNLYFFPEGLKVSDDNISKAKLIHSVKIPAKNGFYPSVGSNGFKIDENNGPGTYVFQSSFPGDDRTQPYSSSVTDKTEQYVVESKPILIHTTASDENGKKDILPTETTTIIDKVSSENLVVGRTYKLVGTLIDKSTGKPFEENGKVVTSEKEFTAKSENQTVEMEFNVDGAAIGGRTFVVFENLFHNDKQVAVHSNINDKGQTVSVEKPTIKTTATFKDGEKVSYPMKEMTIFDKVCYTDLIPGKEYTLDGVLMNKKTNKPLLINGKEVHGSKTFTPTNTNGCETIEFKFDGSVLENTEVVAFENLKYQNIEIATHSDINDKGQTVTIEKPKPQPPQPTQPKPQPSLAITGTNIMGIVGTIVGLVLAGGLLIVLRRKLV